MKTTKHLFTIFLLATLLVPIVSVAQVDFNKTPDDDLGNVSSDYQEFFFEALKQKGIENYQKAVDALEKCLKINDSDATIYFELGKNYNALKNYGAAEDALKKAISKIPDNEWFLDELYDVYVKQKEFDKAIKTVKQLVKYHPDYKEDLAAIYVQTKKYNDALKILDELDEELGVSKQRDYLRNQAYAATGRKKAQIKNLEERVENNPDTEENYLALIYRYSKNDDTNKAFETAKKLLEVNPESELVHLALYKFYLDDSQPEKAISSMKIALNSTKINPEAKLKVLSDFVKFVGNNPQYEKDLVEVTSSITSKEDNAKTLVEVAQYYLVKGEKAKALSFYEEAHKKEPDNFGILRNILLLYIDLEKYDIASQKSSKGLENYPSQPVLYLVNGVANNKLNKPKKAIESLETGLDYVIDDPKMEIDFYKQLSQAYTLQNNFTKAKTFTDKAKQLESTN
ncbi:tetratricopeptide repeat protein [Lacinutrix salivirga]